MFERNAIFFLILFSLKGLSNPITIKFNNIVLFQGHGKADNIFLVPMHGGIWTLCIDLTDADMRQLGRYGFPHASKCISYLAESIELSQHDDYSLHGDYQMARRPSMRKCRRKSLVEISPKWKL